MLPKIYEPEKHESSISKQWSLAKVFEAQTNSNKPPYSIVLPPPNATGHLHLGHSMMLAIQDVLIRYHKMNGYNTLWLPGTDHAGIATQSRVEKNFQQKGVKNPRKTLGREKLTEEIQTFVENSKNTIRSQMKAMGAGLDWSREAYTFSNDVNHTVNYVFENMYKDGLIYQGNRIVNWDPNMQTTVADDEMERKNEKTKFYYLQYGPFVIGTARPETKFGDKYVVMHPDDKRYKAYTHGQK